MTNALLHHEKSGIHVRLAVFSILFLIFVGVSLSGAHAETYKIHAQKMPAHWQKSFGDVLNQAIQYWQNKIPGLTFEIVPHSEESDFVLEWASQYDAGTLGYYSTSTLNHYGKPKVTITLGFFKDKKWNLVSPEYALEITKHEIGHAIGLPHSSDPNDIMYPQIEDYDSWQKSKMPPSSTPSSKALAKTTDWKAKSTKYQALSDQKLYSTKSELLKAEISLNNSTATNKASKVELDKAWNAFWAAKKYLNSAELTQQDADTLFYASSYEDSYYKYKASYDNAKKAAAKMPQIKNYIKKANAIQ
jgi:hypothetical protein